MKKKLLLSLTAIACAVPCVAGLTACSGETEPYYNKTYTLTGKSVIDWDGKIYSDSYSDDDKDYSQKQIIEKHWDKIDWSNTKDAAGTHADILHTSLDAFIASFNDVQENFYKDAKDLKITVSDAATATLTLILPEKLRGDYPAEITMPFAETVEQWNAIDAPTEVRSNVSSFSETQAGHYCVGVYKKADGKYLTVEFTNEVYVDKINLNIKEYYTETSGDETYYAWRTVFAHNETLIYLNDSNDKQIWDLRHKLGYTVEKN